MTGGQIEAARWINRRAPSPICRPSPDRSRAPAPYSPASLLLAGWADRVGYGTRRPSPRLAVPHPAALLPPLVPQQQSCLGPSICFKSL